GYPGGFVSSVIAGSAVMGPIIPPSVAMLIYAYVYGGGISVGKLFLMGVVPGVLVAVALMALVWVTARQRHFPKSDTKFSLGGVVRSLRGALLGLVVPVIILGGILGGAFRGPGRGAVAGLYAVLFGVLWPRRPARPRPGGPAASAISRERHEILRWAGRALAGGRPAWARWPRHPPGRHSGGCLHGDGGGRRRGALCRLDRRLRAPHARAARARPVAPRRGQDERHHLPAPRHVERRVVDPGAPPGAEDRGPVVARADRLGDGVHHRHHHHPLPPRSGPLGGADHAHAHPGARAGRRGLGDSPAATGV